MRKIIIAMLLMSVCSLAVAFTQSSEQQQTDQRSAPSSTSSMGKTVTITGCLQPGTAPNSYVLNNVMSSDMTQQSYLPDNHQPEVREPNQGRADSSDPDQNLDRTADDQNINKQQRESVPSQMARTETSYVLIPDNHLDLKSHLGQRVEAIGQMTEGELNTPESSKDSTSTKQSSSSQGATGMNWQLRFKVSSIRQISPTCQ
jgi:hypothetical protein